MDRKNKERNLSISVRSKIINIINMQYINTIIKLSSVFSTVRGNKFLEKSSAIILLILSAQLTSCTIDKNQSQATLLLSTILMQKTTVLTVGDSLTYYSNGFALDETLDDSFNVYHYGIPGADFSEWIFRLDEGLSVVAGDPPDVIFVALGTNDGYTSTGDSFISNLNNFHQALRLRSSARVYYFKVPLTNDPVLAQKIKANNILLEESLPGTNTDIIDMESEFQNFSNPELLYPLTDPVHPTDYGYTLFREKMKSYL